MGAFSMSKNAKGEGKKEEEQHLFWAPYQVGALLKGAKGIFCLPYQVGRHQQ